MRSRLVAISTPTSAMAVDVASLRGVAAKLLHDPIVGLKDRIDPAQEREVALLLAQLLGLPEPTS